MLLTNRATRPISCGTFAGLRPEKHPKTVDFGYSPAATASMKLIAYGRIASYEPRSHGFNPASRTIESEPLSLCVWLHAFLQVLTGRGRGEIAAVGQSLTGPEICLVRRGMRPLPKS